MVEHCIIGQSNATYSQAVFITFTCKFTHFLSLQGLTEASLRTMAKATALNNLKPGDLKKVVGEMKAEDREALLQGLSALDATLSKLI